MGGNVPLTSVQLARVMAAADGDPDWLVFQNAEQACFLAVLVLALLLRPRFALR